MPGSLVLAFGLVVSLAAWGYQILASSDPSDEVNLAIIHALPTISRTGLHRKVRR